MKHQSASIAGVVALVAVMAGSFGPLGVNLAIAFALAAAFAIGWPHYLGIPAKKTLATVIALTGAAAALAAAFTRGPDYLRWLPVLIALGVGAVFAVQLIRGTGQSHRLESMLGASAGVVIAGLGGGWIAALRFLESDRELMLISGVSAAVALGVGLIPWPDRLLAPLGVVLAALAGPLAALLLYDVHIIVAAVVGAVVAAVLVSFRRLAVLGGPPASAMGAISIGLAPVVSLGTLVYFIDKLLVA